MSRKRQKQSEAFTVTVSSQINRQLEKAAGETGVSKCRFCVAVVADALAKGVRVDPFLGILDPNEDA